MEKDFDLIALHYRDWCALVEKQGAELKESYVKKRRAERKLKAELERRADAKFARPEFTKIESLRYRMDDWVVGFFVGQADIGWCADREDWYAAGGLFRTHSKMFASKQIETSVAAPAALSFHDAADIDAWLDELISYFLNLKRTVRN